MTKSDSSSNEHTVFSEQQRTPGPINRRTFLAHDAAASGVTAVSALGLMTARDAQAAETIPTGIAPWQTTPGAPMRTYGMPSRFEEPVQRFIAKPYGDLAPGTGISLTPLEALEGTITPSGLHFERHHNGVPDID